MHLTEILRERFEKARHFDHIFFDAEFGGLACGHAFFFGRCLSLCDQWKREPEKTGGYDCERAHCPRIAVSAH